MKVQQTSEKVLRTTYQGQVQKGDRNSGVYFRFTDPDPPEMWAF